MKKYEVQYWEKEAVWVKRTVIIPSDKDVSKMTEDELQNEIESNEDVEWLEGDYNYESTRILEYDFKNDFSVEEVK